MSDQPSLSWPSFIAGDLAHLGGRSISWSGLIPTIQPWELAFFFDQVRQDLAGGLLVLAGGG
jgi:hypothetical protein